ncbi:nrps [Epichloe bromicola]|uniref:Nrps n=1 Tax=Epichloe bromicola TaxID=79588 RepID=A0ABQ0CKK4_9HYPO
MGSVPNEEQPPWATWDACRVLNKKENGSALGQAATTQFSVDKVSLSNFCQSQRATESTVVKLACCIAVGAYAGVGEACVGSRADGVQSVLRCHLDPDQTVARLLQEFQEIDLTAVRSSRNLLDLIDSAGLFDVILAIHGQSSGLEWAGTETRPDSKSVGIETSHATGTSAAHVMVEVDLSEQTINITCPAYKEAAIWAKRLADLISQTITALVKSPDERLCDLDLLPPSDAVEIARWNDRDLGSYQTCLHDEIRKRADERPDSLAVCAWDGDFTYRELDVLSSRVAWKLCHLGADVGSTVAFLFHKSKWTIVALLGILKSGASAVALNHDYPEERSLYILGITGVRILLVGRDLQDSLQSSLGDSAIAKVVVDEAHFPLDVPSEPDTAERFTSSKVEPDDVAYIQFTSGSTGTPKGIMLEHRTYMASAVSQHESCHVNENSRVLEFASHSFDAILVEVITPLLAGGCVCIASEQRRLNDLAGAIRDFQVNWMGLTPTLTRTLRPEEVPSLNVLCTWGEAATSDIIDSWADKVELINIYGPSENSVESTAHSWSKGDRDPSHLGRAMKAVNTWIVRIDNRERLAPIGTVGELAFQGPTVARGYLKDDSRNADSFRNYIPWLRAEERHQRIYYSGDLARYTSDGSIEFVGRRDTQVKIRGHRIELGEIEYHINQNLSASHAGSVVDMIAPSYRPTQRMLVAFINESNESATIVEKIPLKPASDQSRAKAADMEAYLANRLPTHFVPSLYLPLGYMPTNASGKANRRALKIACESLTEPELLAYSSSLAQTKIAPQTDLEVKVASLWSELLGVPVENIGRDDGFFWLGGNSILAMKFAVTAGREGFPLTVAEVLNNPRLAQLASLVEGMKRRSTDGSARPEQPLAYQAFSTLPKELGDDFVSNVIAQRLGVEVEDIQDVALATDYQIENLAWSSLKTRGGTNYLTFNFSGTGVDALPLQHAIERLVMHHDILRTVYLAHGKRVFQVVMNRLPMDVVHCLYSRDTAKTTAAIVEADAPSPVDIARSLLKCWLIRGQDGATKTLILRASHLQYDGVSQIRLCKELGLAFTGQNLLSTASFPGYTHFAATHNEEAARVFWQKTLAGSSMTSVFRHTSIPWKHVLDGQVETIIDTGTVRSDSEITIGTTIKTAWSLVLAEMSGSKDIVFGSVIWGRNAMYPGVEHVTGACIDNIPVRVRLEDNITRRQLLQQVQGQYFEAVSFESFRFKRIVEECTDWSPWERLSTLVEYENLGEEVANFSLDETHSFEVDEIRPPADRHDITIYSTPVGPDKTFIALDFCKAAIPASLAQNMLDRLVYHIQEFHHEIDESVELQPLDVTNLPAIPMSLPASPAAIPVPVDSGAATSEPPPLTNSVTRSGEKPLGDTKKLVESAWTDILSCNPESIAVYWSERTPFYEVWGNLVAAYGLAKYYRDAGIDITMEQVLHSSDMRAQEELISKQQ